MEPKTTNYAVVGLGYIAQAAMHCEYTVRAAEKGIHVLCEKPMAVTEDECLQMIEAAKSNRVKLMIAYRLHFEEANLKARAIVRSGQLGAPRIFNSVFTMKPELVHASSPHPAD